MNKMRRNKLALLSSKLMNKMGERGGGDKLSLLFLEGLPNLAQCVLGWCVVVLVVVWWWLW